MEKSDSSPLSRQVLYASKKEWERFLSIFLLAAGVGFTVSGIAFFFAYNWDELPKFAKLGIVEVLLASSVLLAVFARWSKLIKQILLTGATFLTGTLLAVFGQIYQTGADAYDLFLGWTLFTVLWAIAARFAPLWLTFIGLLCTTIWLYNIQISTHGSWEMVLLANAVTWVCASAAAIAEWMSAKGNLNKQNHWFVDILSLAGYRTYQFSFNVSDIRYRFPCCNNLLGRKKRNGFTHQHNSCILRRTMVGMEKKKPVLFGRYSFCGIDDSIVCIYMPQQSERC